MTSFLGRFAIFIDGQSLYQSARDLNLHIDYRRLLAHFVRQGDLLRAYYYTPIHDGAPDWLIRLKDWLSYNGYKVCVQPTKLARRRAVDLEGNPVWISEPQGSVVVPLTVEALTLAPHLDTIVLASANREFTALVSAIQARGCRVHLLSTDRTSESKVADELRRQADTFIELETIRDEICTERE